MQDYGPGPSSMLSDKDDDYFVDIAEQGRSTESLSDECYYPIHKARGWVRCCVTISGSNVDDGGVYFRLYLEGSNRILLSAKQIDNNTFLISNNDVHSGVGYVASATRIRDTGSFIITTNSCRLCDNTLGHFTCGRGADREIVAKVSHSIHKNYETDVEMRVVRAMFPYLNHNVLAPDVMKEGRRSWCPRTLLNTGPASMPLDTHFIDRIPFHPNIIKCVNKLPVWNEEADTLMLNFQMNRVLSTSVCNFLMYDERKLLVSKQQQRQQQQAQNTEQDSKGQQRKKQQQEQIQRPAIINTSRNSGKPWVDQINISADHGLLQFGRVAKDKFILDFKYPLSVLQAFGISICGFAFDDTPRKKKKQEKDTGIDIVPPMKSPSYASSSSPSARARLRSKDFNFITTASSTTTKTSSTDGYSSDGSDGTSASRDSYSTWTSNRSNLSYMSNSTSSSSYAQQTVFSNMNSGQDGKLQDIPLGVGAGGAIPSTSTTNDIKPAPARRASSLLSSLSRNATSQNARNILNAPDED
jgi:hypothetical protein